MRNRGALVQCGPGMRGAGWPDSPTVRLTALAPWLQTGVAASHLTAAWVWGALDDCPKPLSVSSDPGNHRRVKHGSRHHELRFAAGDRIHLGEFQVTTPARTVLDLLHTDGQLDDLAFGACVRLLRDHPGARDRVASSLARYSRPWVKRAREHFAALAATHDSALDSPQRSPKE